jgi:hypothetical protein
MFQAGESVTLRSILGDIRDNDKFSWWKRYTEGHAMCLGNLIAGESVDQIILPASEYS